MPPVSTEPAVFRRRPLVARTLLWAALALLVIAQILNLGMGRPILSEWLNLADLLEAATSSSPFLHTGAPYSEPPWDWIGTFVGGNLFILTAPWLVRVLTAHALLRGLARALVAGLVGSLGWCIFRYRTPGQTYEIGIWAESLLLPAILTLLGLLLLTGRKAGQGSMATFSS